MPRILAFGWRVAIAALLLLAVGCRRPGPSPAPPEVSYNPAEDPAVNPPSLFQKPPEDVGQIATDETLYFQLIGSPNTLNPLFASSLYEFIVLSTLYAGPFTFDKEMQWGVDEEITESWTESQDHTEFTITLRPGLTWQDGIPFTAHDIVFSWQQILDPRVPAQTQKASTELIKECLALDDRTVRYVQPEPMATSRWNLLFSIIPKHLFERQKQQHPDLKTGEYYTRLARMPVGSGPYRVVQWRENDRIVVERWDDYIGQKPYFKRIVFRIVPDANVSLLSFEREEVDYAALSAQQFSRDTNTDTFRRVGYKAWGVQWAFGYIGWNMDGTNPFFTDRRVRHAMTHALNLPLILDKVFYNLATPCHGIYHPDAWMYNPDVQLLDYDPAKAAALLDEAGWRVDPERGWRCKQIDGREVPFEFTILYAQGSPTAPRIAAILQEDLKKLGVQMKTRTLEWATFLEKVRKHEFQAEMAGWGTGTDPDTGWNLWRTEEYQTGRNYGGYSNARVDQLFEAGRREFDFEKRRAIYQAIHKLIYDDQPYTWIYNAPILCAFNKRIHGVQFSPRGVTGFDPGMSAWWVAKGQAKYAP